MQLKYPTSKRCPHISFVISPICPVASLARKHCAWPQNPSCALAPTYLHHALVKHPLCWNSGSIPGTLRPWTFCCALACSTAVPPSFSTKQLSSIPVLQQEHITALVSGALQAGELQSVSKHIHPVHTAHIQRSGQEAMLSAVAAIAPVRRFKTSQATWKSLVGAAMGLMLGATCSCVPSVLLPQLVQLKCCRHMQIKIGT